MEPRRLARRNGHESFQDAEEAYAIGKSIGENVIVVGTSTGASLACPDRPVINIQADGSAMYTLQAFWTQAREQLNVTTLICNNRGYRILGVELKAAGVQEFGPQSAGLISLANPTLEWVKIAGAMGVPGVKVETAEDLVRELETALSEAGPHLIEMML